MSKGESCFSFVELFIALVLVILLIVVGWLVYSNRHGKLRPTYTSYSDCLHHGGQTLMYDEAIQFDACKGSGSDLYLQYSAQNLPRIEQNKTTTIANQVTSSGSDTHDLIDYLTNNYSGCSIGQPPGSIVTGYYKIIKESAGSWALLNYGCSGDTQNEKESTFMIAMKLSGGWVEISPTNNFLPNGTPSCLLIDMFRVPASLTRQCYQNTGYNDGSLRSVSTE